MKQTNIEELNPFRMKFCKTKTKNEIIGFINEIIELMPSEEFETRRELQIIIKKKGLEFIRKNENGNKNNK